MGVRKLIESGPITELDQKIAYIIIIMYSLLSQC